MGLQADLFGWRCHQAWIVVLLTRRSGGKASATCRSSSVKVVVSIRATMKACSSASVSIFAGRPGLCARR
jgi:hypothetical protein